MYISLSFVKKKVAVKKTVNKKSPFSSKFDATKCRTQAYSTLKANRGSSQFEL